MTRAEWIVGILIALFITGIVLILLLIVPKGSGNPAPAEQVAIAPTSVFSGSTSMQAYELAQESALQWQPDAILLKATTTWPQGASREDLMTGVTLWNLGFYSPASGLVANYSVVDGQVKLVNQHKLDQPLSPKQAKDWRIDSSVAIYRLLDEGGDQFLNDNGVSTLTMALTTDNQSDRLEWLMSAFGVQSNKTLTMRLDASTGEVLETVQSP